MINKKFLAVLLAAGIMFSSCPSPVWAKESSGAEEVLKNEEAPTEEEVSSAEEVVQDADGGQTEADAADTAGSDDADATDLNQTANSQKLDASYTLALNAISNEDYDKAREYLNICFAYCNPQTNPVMYADLLLKRGCLDVMEGNNDMALLSLDAAIEVEPELSDAYLVRAQIYAQQADTQNAIENLEKYIELTQDTSMYETVAQLLEVSGDPAAAQAAYDKYVAGAGSEVEEAGFQTGLYKMENGDFEEAVKEFEAYADNETYGAGAMYNIGICQMNLGKYADAVSSFTSCVEKEGNYDGVYYNRGVCYLLDGKWKEAEEDFAKSIESESYADDALYNEGICQMQQEKYQEAVDTFTELIGDGEKDAKKEEGSKKKKSKKKKEEAAAEEAAKTEEAAAEEAAKTEEAAAEEAAKTEEAAEEAAKTEEAAEEAAKSEEAATEEAAAEGEAAGSETEHVVNDGAYYYRAACRAALGDLEGALKDYTVCIDHEYDLSQSYYQRALVYEALGDKDNQSKDLESSLKYAE